MNYKPCIEAMKWFREKIVFSRDFTDINRNLIDYREDESMLQAIVSAAKTADVGIEDIQFEKFDIGVESLRHAWDKQLTQKKEGNPCFQGCPPSI